MIRQNRIMSIIGFAWGILYIMGRAITVASAASGWNLDHKPESLTELPMLEQTTIVLAAVLIAICIAILVETYMLKYWTVDDEIRKNPSNPATPAYLFLCSLVRPFWLAQLVVETMRFYKGQANAASVGIWMGIAVLSLTFLSLERRRARIRIRHWRISIYVVPEEDNIVPDHGEEKTSTVALEPVLKPVSAKPVGK